VRRAAALCASALGVLLGIGIPGECMLRGNWERPYERTFPGQFENDPTGVTWADPDPELGWVCSRSSAETNPQGFRDARDFALPPDPDALRVMVLGDSFVFGARVERDETIPALLEAELGAHSAVYNLGVSAWGIDQMVLAYHRYKDTLRPQVVVLAFIDDDVRRVLEAFRTYERLNKPCFELRDGALVAQDGPTVCESALNVLGSTSAFLGYLLRHAYVLTDAKPVVRQLLLDLSREMSARGARLVVLRIPTRDETTRGGALRRTLVSIQAAAEEAGALYLDPREELVRVPGWSKELYAGDGHLNLAGNRFMVEFLRRQAFPAGG